LASGARTRTISFDRSSFATITAYGAQIGGGLSLQGVHANGEVLLLGAHIDRDLECDGGTFENPTGKALFLDRAKIGGGVFLKNDNNQPFHAKGEVCLGNARIGGNLECNGGTFENPTGKALFIERAKIGGGVFMSNADNQPFHAIGEVRLVGARIVGTLVCDGGQFENPGVALNFDGAQIGGSVFLRYADSQPFQAKGEVRLLGAHIGGTLACIGQFENPGGNALSFDRAQIRGSVFLGTRGKQLFRALGEVRLPGAHIDGSLVCGGDLFQNPYRDALVCNNSVVKGRFCLMEDAQIVGNVSLAHAEVGTLEDHPSCWPIGSLALDGFRYARIDASSSSDASARIAWLDKQQERFRKGPEFALSPWTHLAYVLREQGHFLEAEKIEITREDRLRRAGRIVRYGWPVHWLYGKLAGYGYKPGRLVVIGFVVWLGCGVLYTFAATLGVFGPTNALVFQNPDYDDCRPDANDKAKNGKVKFGDWTHCPDGPAEYTSFSAFAYSLDRVLPVMSLGEANAWEPITPSAPPAASAPRWVPAFLRPTFDEIASVFRLQDWSLGSIVRLVSWGEEIFGWVAGLTLAGIVSGIVKRRDGS
jgi:hypothetical protein